MAIRRAKEKAERAISLSQSDDNQLLDQVQLEPRIEVPDLVVAGPPPRYTIDLSLPPRQRYFALAAAYKNKITQLPELFDELLGRLQEEYPLCRTWMVKRISRLLLRRVHDSEQMEELIGIQKATAVPMYLLVALNVVLDAIVGCTSGGVRVKGDKDSSLTRMLHLRVLDWEMDPLRNIVVELEFVAHAGGPVVARSITYLGFVGILTGVRQGLSLSFNMRSSITAWDAMSKWQQIRYALGKVLVIMGKRPSIPSILRRSIIPRTRKSTDGTYAIDEGKDLGDLADLAREFPRFHTAQCFVIACDEQKTAVIEKDWKTAAIRESASFIVCTNHDEAEEEMDDSSMLTTKRRKVDEHIPATAEITGMESILEDSTERKYSIEEKWDRVKKTYLKNHPGASEDEVAVLYTTVKRWIVAEPINSPEVTHFACIMDPTRGEILWSERYPEPGLDEYWDSGAATSVPSDRWSIR